MVSPCPKCLDINKGAAVCADGLLAAYESNALRTQLHIEPTACLAHMPEACASHARTLCRRAKAGSSAVGKSAVLGMAVIGFGFALPSGLTISSALSCRFV